MATTSEQLKRLLKKQIKGKSKQKEIMLNTASIPTPIVPANVTAFSLSELDPLEIARQLCLVEQELFR